MAHEESWPGGFTWESYCTWTHETAVKRRSGQADDREVAELLEIWFLGVGGEFCEFLVPHLLYQEQEASLWARDDGAGRTLLADRGEELGDLVYYLARLYVDTGNVRAAVPPQLGDEDGKLSSVARHVGNVVECGKKALRKHGRPGVALLTVPETLFRGFDPQCPNLAGASGRREEFGKLLDLALRAIERWLHREGLKLEEVCLANRKKLERRRAEGTIGAEGKRA